MNEQIVTLSFLDADKKIQWEREQVTEKVTHTKEQYKRFTPQRRAKGMLKQLLRNLCSQVRVILAIPKLLVVRELKLHKLIRRLLNSMTSSNAQLALA